MHESVGKLMSPRKIQLGDNSIKDVPTINVIVVWFIRLQIAILLNTQRQSFNEEGICMYREDVPA